jgi:hypothetical protein
VHEAYWRSIVFDSAGFLTRATSDIRESFNAWRALLALELVYFEFESGQYTPESSEDVLSKLEHTAPYIDWRLQLKLVPGELNQPIWDIFETRLLELQGTTLVFIKPCGRFSYLRRYFVSDLGYLGWVPRFSQEGDPYLCLLWLSLSIRDAAERGRVPAYWCLLHARDYGRRGHRTSEY